MPGAGTTAASGPARQLSLYLEPAWLNHTLSTCNVFPQRVARAQNAWGSGQANFSWVCPEEYSEGKFKVSISHSKYCFTALSMSAFRVCAHQLLWRKLLLFQCGLILVKLLDVNSPTLWLPGRSSKKASIKCSFALHCYIFGWLTYVNISQWQGESSVYMWENRLPEQGSLCFSSSTRLMSGFFPLFSFFPVDEQCFQ